MGKLNLEVRVQVNPTFSWVDWELYDMPGNVQCAAMLNSALKDVLESATPTSTEAELLDTMLEEISGLGKWGALDGCVISFIKLQIEAVLDMIKQ